MNKALYINTPRVYVDKTLNSDAKLILNKDQSHYLIKVMRRTVGDKLRLFNENNGEWFAEVLVENKRECEVRCLEQMRPPQKSGAIHVIFSPVRKHRLEDFIIKGVELGATDFHPVITDHTQIHNINYDRLNKLIIESAEQCERISLPKVHTIITLPELLNRWDKTHEILACVERSQGVQTISSAPYRYLEDVAFIVGPEGGFSQKEKELLLSSDSIIPIALGDDILRVETAIIFMLSVIKYKKL